jgi:hypothetical protein
MAKRKAIYIIKFIAAIKAPITYVNVVNLILFMAVVHDPVETYPFRGFVIIKDEMAR